MEFVCGFIVGTLIVSGIYGSEIILRDLFPDKEVPVITSGATYLRFTKASTAGSTDVVILRDIHDNPIQVSFT